jgi:hypothetical protein
VVDMGDDAEIANVGHSISNSIYYLIVQLLSHQDRLTHSFQYFQ